MGGVLIDSMEYFREGILRVLDEENISYEENLIDIITPLGYKGTAEYYVNVMGAKDTVENITNKIKANLYDAYANRIKIKEGVEEYLDALLAQKTRLFVLTASPHFVTDICLKNNNIYSKFEGIWSVDEFDGLTKSDTRLFYTVAERIGCAPEDINYFDDNIIAIETATKANYNTFAVRDRQTKEVWEQLMSTAKHYVCSFEFEI